MSAFSAACIHWLPKPGQSLRVWTSRAAHPARPRGGAQAEHRGAIICVSPFDALPERQAMAYAAKRPRDWTWRCRFMHPARSRTGALFDTVINRVASF